MNAPNPSQPALPPHLRGHYQLPDSPMTLREGLAEYYRVNPGLSDPKGIQDPKSARYFRCHDTTHVLFGTHTGDINEAANDLWTYFGVQISYVDYAAGFFSSSEAKKISKEFASWRIFTVSWYALRLIPELRRRGKRLHKRWPWEPPETAYDRPLVELRAEYGVEVFVPEDYLGVEGSHPASPRSQP